MVNVLNLAVALATIAPVLVSGRTDCKVGVSYCGYEFAKCPNESGTRLCYEDKPILDAMRKANRPPSENAWSAYFLCGADHEPVWQRSCNGCAPKEIGGPFCQ